MRLRVCARTDWALSLGGDPGRAPDGLSRWPLPGANMHDGPGAGSKQTQTRAHRAWSCTLGRLHATRGTGQWRVSPGWVLIPIMILSRVGVTWYTFKQKAPKFRVDWYKGAYFCKIVKFFGHYNRLKRQTLNGRLPPEDSSVFDDSVCVLIVMT